MHYLSYVGCPRCRVARVGGGDPPFARITDEGGPIGSPSPPLPPRTNTGLTVKAVGRGKPVGPQLAHICPSGSLQSPGK